MRIRVFSQFIPTKILEYNDFEDADYGAKSLAYRYPGKKITVQELKDGKWKILYYCEAEGECGN